MAPSRRRGFTKIELAIYLLVVALLLAVAVPAVQHARESSRRAHCLNNLKQIGIAFQNMDSAKRRFPSSCTVTRDAQGQIVAMDGWSWSVWVHVYLCDSVLWNTLDIENGVPLVDGTANTVLAVETVEQRVARWTLGNETCLVGLPPVVTFQESGTCF